MNSSAAQIQIPRACMVVFSHYPMDLRVRRAAEALVEADMSVDVICLKGQDEPHEEIVDGVCVFRIPLQRKRARRLRYHCEYLLFFLLTFLRLSVLHLQRPYSLIHVHNMPDILVFSALIPRLTGAKVILDLHDPMPEVYMAKYFKQESHLTVRLLRVLEKCSIWMADLVITPNIAFSELFISRSCSAWKIHVIMNSPQEKIFHKGNATMNQDNAAKPKDHFVLMYHGTLVQRNGIHKALQALSLLRDRIPNILLHVYGEGDYVNRFRDHVEELALADIVKYHGEVHPEKIAEAMREIDVGLIPNEHSTHWNLAFPTRILEYLCMEKAVIAPRTKGIKDYFDEDSMFFFESGNSKSLAGVIVDVYRNPCKRQEVLTRGISIYNAHRWELQKSNLVLLTKNLLGV